MIASTLEEMTDGYGGPRLIPPGGRLDLVLTRTDLYGWPRHLPVDARFHDVLLETAHAHQMRFQFRRTVDPSRQGADRDFRDDFGLTYAARTTAGFPIAFAPVGYRTAAKSFNQARHGETFADQDTFAARHLPEHHLAAYKAATAWMVDGGILDNKPFSAVIRLIEEKPADRSVYRTLMYIEPDPALADSARPAPMPLPREMPSLLYKLFRHEPIFADLHTVATRNRLVERLIKIADAAEAHGERIMSEALAETPRNLEQLRVAANDHLRTGNNPSYPGYTVLKARRAAETLAGSISAALGHPHESRHGYFVRQIIRGYFRQQRAFAQPEYDTETSAYSSNSSQIDLLKAFDVPYRLRRLRYLVRVANDQYGRPGMSADAVDTLKGALMRVTLAFDELTEWVRGQGEEVGKRLQQDVGADLDTYIRGYAGDLSELDSAGFPGIDGLCGWLRTHFIQTMNDQGEVVRHAISNLQGPLHDRIAKAYVVYPIIDSAIFPMMDSAGVRDLSTTRVIRVSPHDANALSGEPRRLKSRELGEFAGFLRRDAREHDLLWGRLDGAERLIDLIVAAACGDTPTLPNEILKLRSAALNAAIEAILDESERGGKRYASQRYHGSADKAAGLTSGPGNLVVGPGRTPRRAPLISVRRGRLGRLNRLRGAGFGAWRRLGAVPRIVLTLCSGRKVGAVVVRGLTADRNGPTGCPVFRASRWIAGCSGTAGARGTSAGRVIKSDTKFFSVETWPGGTWRGNVILVRRGNVQAAMGSNSVKRYPVDRKLPQTY